MVKSKGKLEGEGSTKRVRIVWTAGWVEPGDKWMMVTIINLSAAPNPLVGPEKVAPKGCIRYIYFCP